MFKDKAFQPLLRTTFGTVVAVLFVVSILAPYPVPAHADVPSADSVALHLTRTLDNDFSITALAWHPDGKQLAVGQVLNNRVAIWDVQTGKLVRRLEGERGGVSSLAYSQDGKFLAVGREFTRVTQSAHVHLYDAQSGELLHSFVSPKEPVRGDSNDANALAFSPDSKYLVANGYGSSRTAVVYDVATRKPVHVLADSEDPGFRVINAIAFSPDDRFVVLGRVSGRVDVWSASDWKLVKRLKGQTGGVYALAFSPNGNYFVSGTNVGERWDRSQKPPRQIFDKFSDDVILWSVPAFVKAAEFSSRYFKQTPNSSIIHRLQFSPDGKYLLVGARSKAIEIIDVEGGKTAMFKEGFRSIVEPTLSPNGKYLAIALGKKIEIHQLTVH